MRAAENSPILVFMPVTIRPAAESDLPAISTLLGESFAEIESLAALVGGDPAQRLGRMFGMWTKKFYLPHGYVDVAEDQGRIVGVALWAYPKRYMSLIDDIRLLPTYVKVLRWRLIPAARRELITGSYHPKEAHWYLFAIGVAGAGQGKGTGSALLEHGLARVGDGTVYLEAANSRAARLYQRFGFVPMGPLPGPKGFEPEIAMVRYP